MKDNSPPFYLLFTLEAVVRLRSFKSAAVELHLTPSAVSHRVSSLEKMAGQNFFIRDGGQTLPTESAVRLANSVSNTVADLQRIWSVVKNESDEKIFRISSFPAFATHFLFPTFHEFVEVHHNVALELGNRNPLERLQKGLIDVAICYGEGPFPGFYSYLLRRSSVVPIISPALFSQLEKGEEGVPFLDFSDDNFSWRHVLSDLGLDQAVFASSIRCDSVGAAFSAAMAGLGLALVPDWLAKQGVASGSVVALGASPLVRKYNYWLISRLGEENRTLNAEFAKWLRKKIEENPVSSNTWAERPISGT